MVLANDRYTYRIAWSDEDSQYVGMCAEFPSLSWLADTSNEAFQGIRDVVEDVVLDMRANGEPGPEPLAMRRYSGQFRVRIPPEAHRSLALEAAEANISINRLVNTKLAQQVRH